MNVESDVVWCDMRKRRVTLGFGIQAVDSSYRSWAEVEWSRSGGAMWTCLEGCMEMCSSFELYMWPWMWKVMMLWLEREEGARFGFPRIEWSARWSHARKGKKLVMKWMAMSLGWGILAEVHECWKWCHDSRSKNWGGDDPARLGFVSENPVALRQFFLWRGTEIK